MAIVIYGLLIVNLVTTCHSHIYYGLIQGPHYNIVQSRLIWEWHGYGQFELPNNQNQHIEDGSNLFNGAKPMDLIGEVFGEDRGPNNQNQHIEDGSNLFNGAKPLDLIGEVFGEDRGAPANQQELPSAPTYNATHNPCTREIARKNYKRPGRRISDEMCLQFIGEMKAREDEIQKSVDCAAYYRQYLGKSQFPVVGGRIAEPGEFLHMGALGWKGVDGGWVFKCGASIVSEKFLVTASHCIRSAKDPKISNQEPEIVRIGAKNLGDLAQYYPKDYKIAKIIKHPNYKPPKQYFDIALIELEKKIYFDDNVQPACLWNLGTDNLRTKVAASGWGTTEVGGKTTTTQLRVGDLDLVRDSTCDELLRPLCNHRWCGLQEHQVCAGKLDGGVDACNGDSGGPLQFKIDLPASVKGRMYYLLGVTSFGFGCARQNSPGVYTRISSFVDWIESIVWRNETQRS